MFNNSFHCDDGFHYTELHRFSGYHSVRQWLEIHNWWLDDSKGDGRTSDDIQISANGSIYLRAERSGKGSSRVYTITYQAVDGAGNVVVDSATVTVPHDKR